MKCKDLLLGQWKIRLAKQYSICIVTQSLIFGLVAKHLLY